MLENNEHEQLMNHGTFKIDQAIAMMRDAYLDSWAIDNNFYEGMNQILEQKLDINTLSPIQSEFIRSVGIIGHMLVMQSVVSLLKEKVEEENDKRENNP